MKYNDYNVGNLVIDCEQVRTKELNTMTEQK